MLKLNVLVRKPIGIETAGSLNILFSDKTGTITKGQLEVVEFFDGAGKDIPIDKLHEHSDIKGHMDLAIFRNTDAMYDCNSNVVGGNSTDNAVLRFLGQETCLKLSDDPECEVTTYQCFNSTNKYSSVHLGVIGKTFYKGAPEKLIDKATKYINRDGKEVDINKKVVTAKVNELASKAMRVLAFGYSKSALEENMINDDIVIIGFIGIRDDVRPEAKAAIAEVHYAGIQVVMITGDRKDTAMAIAKDAGLLQKKTDIALTSEELNQLSDDELKKMLPNIRVIARALPTDKSRMVRICQELNLVVGMTGDGVNDSPALKRADVGFAMGSGTAVAKEAGDIVILDDNFQSIRNAILYGRTIYHNILKFCRFQLVINVAAVLTSALAPVFGIEEPLKVVHLLWINLVMDGLAAIMLGEEPALEHYMVEKPKRRDESIISKQMLSQVCIIGLFITAVSFWFLTSSAIRGMFSSDVSFDTGYFTLFIMFSVFNSFNVRNTSLNILFKISENKKFFKILGVIVVIQILIATFGGVIFNCAPFGLREWIVVMGIAASIIPVDMVRKLITNMIYKENIVYTKKELSMADQKEAA